MLRITRFSSNRAEGPEQALKAIQAAQEAAEAVSKVPGARGAKLYLAGGSLVFVGEADGYATSDAILKDAACQAAFGRLIAEHGYAVDGDEFLMEPAQVYPFLKK